MCGIIAGVSLDGHNVNEEVFYQYQDQQARGARGFGAAMLEAGQKKEDLPLIHVRRATEEVGTICDLKLFPSTLILFHHRTPTSSDNKIQQTHPILVSNPCLQYDWLITHNGMIQNSDQVKKAHEALGFKYSTDDGSNTRNYNDSECIATDVALLLEREHIKKDFGFEKNEIEAKGSAAIVGLQIDKATQSPISLFYGRNAGNPLKAFRDQRIIFISSEGKGELVKPGELTVIDLQHPKLKQKTYEFIIPYYYQGYDKSQHSSLPIRNHNTTIQTSKTWPKDEATDIEDPTAGDSCAINTAQDEDFDNEFSFTVDPNMMEVADKMYDELELMAHQFIETICNKDGIEFSDQAINEMRQKMENYQEKMEDYWQEVEATDEALGGTKDPAEIIVVEGEQAKTDAIVVEAARDNKISVIDALTKSETPQQGS